MIEWQRIDPVPVEEIDLHELIDKFSAHLFELARSAPYLLIFGAGAKELLEEFHPDEIPPLRYLDDEVLLEAERLILENPIDEIKSFHKKGKKRLKRIKR